MIIIMMNKLTNCCYLWTACDCDINVNVYATPREEKRRMGLVTQAMDIQPMYHLPNKYIETASGNKVSTQSTLAGSQNIVLNGKSIVMERCILRADLASLKIGKNTIIREGAILRPPFKKFAKGVAFFPLYVGEHVYIGENSIVNAAQVGSYTHIGKDCVIGRLCVLKDCCAVLDGTVLAPETVVPTFAVFAGNPGKQVGELPEITQELMIDFTWSFYRNLLPISKKPKDEDGKQK